MKDISKKAKEFNDFRFSGLNWKQHSNQYITMDRVGADKIVVKVGGSHLIRTRYGWALILDYSHVVFLKEWQVSCNYFGNEVLIQKDFFNVKEWGQHEEFEESPELLTYEAWAAVAKEQDELLNEDGEKANRVRWEI